MIADEQVPGTMAVAMGIEGGDRDRDRDRDLDETLSRYARRRDDNPPPVQHPVKDVVLPLAVVIGLLVNALMIGVAWGRFSQRMDTYEGIQATLEQRVTKAEEAALNLRDRMRDAERDIKEDQRRFLMLDDYTRGRVDRLPYKAPPPARW